LEEKNWYALYTKPRHEFKAEERLKLLGIENYLPKLKRIKQWSDRKKKVVEPLFNGYIFIRANEKERLEALEQNMIIKTVFFDGKPSVIPATVIDGLKNVIENSDDVKILNGIVKGTKVKVIDGPFNGVSGTVYEVSKHESMLAITIDLLNRSVVVKLPSSTVTKSVPN
jgi:transcription antitermination factor NusG